MSTHRRMRGECATWDCVDSWLAGTWMDDPDFHDGYSEIRPRREPLPLPRGAPKVVPKAARRARPANEACPVCGAAA